jgi:hypothetical protein
MYIQVQQLLTIILNELSPVTGKRDEDYPEYSKRQWIYGLILLLFPTMATKTSNQKRWDSDFDKALADSHIKQTYWKIFKENNLSMRKEFFKDQLI